MATASPWDDGHALPHWLSLGHLLLQAVLNAGGGSEFHLLQTAVMTWHMRT
jgi:hypothetical protein